MFLHLIKHLNTPLKECILMIVLFPPVLFVCILEFQLMAQHT